MNSPEIQGKDPENKIRKCDNEEECTSYDKQNVFFNNLNIKTKSYESVLSLKRKRESDDGDLLRGLELLVTDFKWKIIQQDNLNLKYAKVFSKSVADSVFKRLEEEVEYYSGDLLKVKVYGKWHNIPRKQVAFGEDGLSYKFSGICVPAKSWNTCPIIFELKKCVESLTRESFNFVLVNRYKNGEDHMGEHRDDEKELDVKAPIASFSFGQVREFIFKHKDARGKTAKRKDIPVVKKDLESGSLLLMEWPTNTFWYHSLPVRKNALGVRINLTFRRILINNASSKA